MDDKQPLLLGDLESPLVKKLFDRLIISTIRRCFLTYSPVIGMVCVCVGTLVYSMVYWGYNQIIDRLDILTKHQEIQDIKVDGIEYDLYKIKIDVNSLKDK